MTMPQGNYRTYSSDYGKRITHKKPLTLYNPTTGPYFNVVTGKLKKGT